MEVSLHWGPGLVVKSLGLSQPPSDGGRRGPGCQSEPHPRGLSGPSAWVTAADDSILPSLPLPLSTSASHRFLPLFFSPTCQFGYFFGIQKF